MYLYNTQNSTPNTNQKLLNPSNTHPNNKLAPQTTKIIMVASMNDIIV